MPEAVPKEKSKPEESVAVEKVAPTAVAENGSSGESNGQGDGQAAVAATKDSNAAVVESVDDAAAQSVPPKEMRSVVLAGFGNLKNIKVTKKPEPVLKSGEVLIRVKLCGLGFQDLHVRQGSIDGVPKCPFTMGFECAGVVEQIASEGESESNGNGNSNGNDNGNSGGDSNAVAENAIKVGDRVVAFSEYSAWAELVAVPAKHVYVIPDDMAYSDAVALVMNYVIAHILVFDMANISAGKSVLVHSAAGGIGMAIAQLCATVNQVSVIGICSKPKLELLKDNAYFSHVIERNSEYLAEVRKISPEGVDVIFDCMGGDEFHKGYGLLKPMGRSLLYGSSNIMNFETKSLFSITKSWWQAVKISPMRLVDDNKSLAGLNLKKLLFKFNKSDYVRSSVEKVFNLWQEKKLKPIIDSTWALEDVQEAMQKMHSHNNIGKIVLDPSMEPKPKQPTPVKSKDKKKQQSTEEKKQSEATASVATTVAADAAAAAAATPAANDSVTTAASITTNANEEAAPAAAASAAAPDTAPVTNGASA